MCVPVTPVLGVGDKGNRRLTGAWWPHPSSNFSERPCFKGMRVEGDRVGHTILWPLCAHPYVPHTERKGGTVVETLVETAMNLREELWALGFHISPYPSGHFERCCHRENDPFWPQVYLCTLFISFISHQCPVCEEYHHQGQIFSILFGFKYFFRVL